MGLLRQFLDRLDRPGKCWGVFLVSALVAQICILNSIGDEGRDAPKERIAKTEAQIIEDGTTFEDEAERENKIFRSIRLREHVSWGLWVGAAIGIAVCSGLLISLYWWGRPTSQSSVSNGPPAINQKLVYVLIGIAIIATAFRAPRLDLSLYNDESYNFTRYIHGQFKPDKVTGETVFHPQTWQTTVWGNNFGNNGAFFSILSRLGHDAAQKIYGTVDGEVIEPAFRLPSLLAGAFGIVVIGLLGTVVFGKKAGLLAGTLAALHPWYYRYATEGRAYGMVILFAALILLSLILAVRDGRWRWWILFGLAQFFCLWSYIGSVYFLVAANLAVLIWLGISRRELIPRWLVANALGAVLFLQIAMPMLPQLVYILKTAGTLQGVVSLDSAIEILSYFLSGMPVVTEVPENPIAPSWDRFGGLGIGLFWCLVIAFLATIGKIIHSKSAKGIFVASVGIGAVTLAIIVSNITGGVVHHWYVIYALPVFVILLAAGVVFLFKSFGKAAAGALLVLILFGFQGIVGYSKQSKQQLAPLMREVRGEVYPFDGQSGHPLLAALWSDTVYDPTIIYTPSLDDLKEAIERSKREDRPLFVEFGFRSLALKHNPDVIDFIENSGQFEHLKTFPGLEQSQFTHHLFRFVGD